MMMPIRTHKEQSGKVKRRNGRKEDQLEVQEEKEVP